MMRDGLSITASRPPAGAGIGSEEPCGPGRAQGRGVRRLVRVLLTDRCDREARVPERGTDIPIHVEVLPVLLGEGVTVTRRRSSIVVSHVRAPGSTTLLITKSFPADCTRDDGVGDREAHHRVRVEVEDEPACRPEAGGDRRHRQPQLVRSEVVEAVERAHRGVEDTFDRQVREASSGSTSPQGRDARERGPASPQMRRRRRPGSRVRPARPRGGRCRSRRRARSGRLPGRRSRARGGTKPSGHGRGR